ncbi:hypothetical protein GMORB2_2077 [Geosmithia morbida]|uniref:DUF7598 domain-containing protein n=1 Tax=Geosmithia morbida TaxID=1094350 RepID=A0A9P5D4N5_9HYPO|nr:uncharacterized protein GMORB2_2077 [Geosmithia morbida]KAF4121669.1 hypothetical protein GMORB2_2077 [Geosmithia morbida]
MVFAFLLGGFVKRGVSMVILQVLRVCTIIVLGTAVVSFWALAVKINMTKAYFVFDAASLVFMSAVSLFLAISELPFGKRFFEQHWPAFSPRHGLGWLGFALVMVGCDILGKLNNPKMQADDLGMPWWRLVLASGILNLVFGLLNVVATFALHDWLGGQNVRVIRTIGAASADASNPSKEYDVGSAYASSSSGGGGRKTLAGRVFGFALGKAKQKAGMASGGRGGGKNASSSLPRFEISHPIPHGKESEDSSRVAAHDAHDDPSHNDYDESQTSPIQPGLARPSNAFHPAFWKGRPASSRYSEANMSRF